MWSLNDISYVLLTEDSNKNGWKTSEFLKTKCIQTLATYTKISYIIKNNSFLSFVFSGNKCPISSFDCFSKFWLLVLKRPPYVCLIAWLAILLCMMPEKLKISVWIRENENKCVNAWNHPFLCAFAWNPNFPLNPWMRKMNKSAWLDIPWGPLKTNVHLETCAWHR